MIYHTVSYEKYTYHVAKITNCSQAELEAKLLHRTQLLVCLFVFVRCVTSKLRFVDVASEWFCLWASVLIRRKLWLCEALISSD